MTLTGPPASSIGHFFHGCFLQSLMAVHVGNPRNHPNLYRNDSTISLFDDYVINACCISHAYVKKPRVKATQGRRDFCVELLWIIVQLDLPSPVLQIDWIKALERAPQEMECQTCCSSTSSEGG